MKHEFISPLYDFMFAQIFGSNENIGITRDFLKTLLDIPEADYNHLTIENPVLKRFFWKDKMGIVDLKLSTKSGRIIHIELQVEKKSHLRSRILYYAARLIGDQLKWGDEYKKLHQVISIIICNHPLIEEEKSYINRYELRNESNRIFTDLLQIVILELPKIPETADSKIWPWMRFFTCKSKEECEMLAQQYPELEEPVFCVKKMSLMEKWRYYHFHKNLYKEDERMREEYLTTEAHEKGKAEGKAVEKIEIAKKLINRNRPIEEIAEDTGLSYEELERLRKQNQIINQKL